MRLLRCGWQSGFKTKTFILCIFLSTGAPGKNFDFQFKEMDLRRVATTLAKMQNRNIVFSTRVESKIVDVNLTGVTPEAALTIVLENYGYLVTERHGILHVIASDERAPASNSTTIIAVTHVLAKEIEPSIRIALAGKAVIAINEQLNSLIVTAPEDALSKVRSLVEELDQQGPQIFIEGQVVQTSTTFSRQLGIEWGPNLSDRSSGISLNTPSANNALTVALTSSSLLQARLTAGESNGDLKIVSSPKISTINGVAANIESSITYNIRTQATVANVVAQPVSATIGLSQVKAGVSMRVTPYIVNKEQVRLQLVISKSDPDFSTAIDGIPGITDNSANTSLVVRSGQTASIGGLISHTKTLSNNGVPFLSKIPVVGALFGTENDQKADQEVLIFLTPTIFHQDGKDGKTANIVPTVPTTKLETEPVREAKAAPAPIVEWPKSMGSLEEVPDDDEPTAQIPTAVPAKGVVK